MGVVGGADEEDGAVAELLSMVHVGSVGLPSLPSGCLFCLFIISPAEIVVRLP